MPLHFQTALALKDTDLSYAYDDARMMLYALAIGMGRDPLDTGELPFVYEKELKVVPTAATIMAWGARDIRTLGVDYAKVLHGEQKLTIHRTLPPRANLLVNTYTTAIYDKGQDKGAVIVSAIDLFERTSRAPLCTLETTHFARGDGGFSSESGDSGEARAPHRLPTRPPDYECELPTLPHQALLYRLLGDRNVLHADIEAARAAGFEKPILHGLCTYGICCHAVLRTICDYDSDLIRQFDVRFSAPVFPGETLRVRLWRDGDIVSFDALVPTRNVVVINNGRCVLRAGEPGGSVAT